MTRSSRDEEYTAFVAARQAHLRRVAYALCGDWHRAEDLLQVSLVKLYVAWPRIHRAGREEAYARQIIVRATIDEALRCKEESRGQTIIFNLCGHGHFDLSAYDRYLSGQIEDYELPASEIERAQAELPQVA